MYPNDASGQEESEMGYMLVSCCYLPFLEGSGTFRWVARVPRGLSGCVNFNSARSLEVEVSAGHPRLGYGGA